MSAGVYNIAIEQNATFELDLYWSSDAQPPVLIDVSGYTGKMQIRAATGGTLLYTLISTSGSPSFTSSLATGGIILSTSGHVQLYIPDTITNGFTWVTGVYDLELVSPTGFVSRILQGTVTVNPAVTTI